MIARLRSLWFAINASYWFFPALFAVLAGLLAIGLVFLDATGRSAWLLELAPVGAARPDSASNMLTVIAGSMISVASTVFAITIAAVAYASGTYGPRLLTNFMEDRGNQFSLATFIGTFVFALMVLRSVRTAEEAMGGFVPQLALLAAFGLMLVAVAVLVYFLHHIPSSIRINTVLEAIGEGLIGKIRDRFPEGGGAEPLWADPPRGAAILSSDTGYIRYIELAALRDCARDNQLRIGLEVRTGDFIHSGKPIARIDRPEATDEIASAVRAAFALGGSRTPEQDIEFSIDELVEIALRALSPGINDPFTAITAVYWLGAATAELGRRSFQPPIGDEDEGGGDVLIPLHDDFEHFLGRGFGAARSAIASNRLTSLVTLDTMLSAARVMAGDERRGLMAREANLLLAQCELELRGPDLEEVRTRHRVVRSQMAAETVGSGNAPA